MSEPVNVIISKEMLINELYRLRSLIPTEEIDAKNYLDSIVNLVSQAPTDEQKNNYPRIGWRTGI